MCNKPVLRRRQHIRVIIYNSEEVGEIVTKEGYDGRKKQVQGTSPEFVLSKLISSYFEG
jgi:hypothetical protein